MSNIISSPTQERLPKDVVKILQSCIDNVSQNIKCYCYDPVTNFTRNRVWTPDRIINYLIQMESKPMQSELDNYFTGYNNVPYDSSLCQQRAKLMPAAFERVSALLRELETEDGCVLLVAHALILRLIRLYLLGLPLDNMMDVHTAGCCFCEAHYRNGRWELVSFADDRCQSPDYDPERYAYFGSPVPVEGVPADAVLTPYSELAAAYAHAPKHVEIALNGIVSHDGTADGLLYRLDLHNRSVTLMGPAPAMRVDGPAYL